MTQNIPHGVTQVHYLTMEIACLVWAHVLLNLVYKFVETYMASHRPPPIQIPHMHLVEASLAIKQNSEARAFLLEEVIGEDEGHFRKNLNNVLAALTSCFEDNDEEHAKFLAFSQHVQFFKTKKLAFVADYQGKPILIMAILHLHPSLT